MKLFKSIFSTIYKSVDGSSNTVSSVRVQSYLLLLPILLMSFCFIGIEVWSFLHSKKTGGIYHISNEIIVVFGMVLSHHLALLFNRNKAQSIAEIKGDAKPAVEEVVDAPESEDKN